jgi:murein DD-endopeptidase MepM/ murein hydrolase activator NlpD
MTNKKKRNLIIVLTLIAAMFCATFVSSFAVSQEEKDAAMKEAKDAQKATEQKREEAKAEAKKAAQATANFEEAEKKLGELQGEIEATQAQISNTMAEIEAKEKEIEEQNTALNNRLTAMYKTGNSGFVDVILNSENVEDLLSNIGMVQKILESDQDLLRKLQKDYKKLKALKAQLEEQQIALEAQQIETEELKKKYQAEADAAHAAQAQKEAEAAAMAADAAAKQAAAEAMIVEAGGQVQLAPGEYAWPTAANWELSDKYGWRICPFHGREFHNGLDIILTSGTNGSPVYAIADGVVTRASWYGGYGNCIQYATGNGISVLYGHLSGYNCSEGQFVKKGTVLGYIGSTGASTGPHLHFTVFQDGVTISPLSLY